MFPRMFRFGDTYPTLFGFWWLGVSLHHLRLYPAKFVGKILEYKNKFFETMPELPDPQVLVLLLAVPLLRFCIHTWHPTKEFYTYILRHDIPFLTRWTKSPPCWSSYCRCQRVTVGMTRSCGQCMSIVGGLGTYSCHLPTGLCFFNLKLPVQRPNWLALWTEHGLSNSIQFSKFMPTI